MTISFLVLLQMEMYSKDQARQSLIVLFLINPYWLTWIREMISSCRLCDSSFMISLMEELRREIGL